MKKILTAVALILSMSLTSSAQTLTAQSYLQKTVMGVQKGVGLRIQLDKGWGIGLVHQANLKAMNEGVSESYAFSGIEAMIPVAACQNVKFFFSPKAGFVSNQFFVVIPEVETQIKITNRFSAGVTTGIRARESSTGVKLFIHL